MHVLKYELIKSLDPGSTNAQPRKSRRLGQPVVVLHEAAKLGHLLVESQRKPPLLAKNARNGAPSLFKRDRSRIEMWATRLGNFLVGTVGEPTLTYTVMDLSKYPIQKLLFVVGGARRRRGPQDEQRGRTKKARPRPCPS
jgi:hypothetical protein